MSALPTRHQQLHVYQGTTSVVQGEAASQFARPSANVTILAQRTEQRTNGTSAK